MDGVSVDGVVRDEEDWDWKGERMRQTREGVWGR